MKKVVVIGIGLCVSVISISFYLDLSLQRQVFQESKKTAFERYVLKKIPPGVRVIKKGGLVSLAGGEEWVVLELSLELCEQIVEAHKLKEYDDVENGEREDLRDDAHKIATDEGIIPFHYYTDSELNSASWKIFVLNEDYTKGLFLRGRI